MNLRYRIEYAAVVILLGICRILPRKLVYLTSHALTTLGYHLIASRRKMSLRNIEIVFPDKTTEERIQIAKSCYKNIGEMIAYNILMITGRITNEELLDSIEEDGFENFEEALKIANGRGLLIFTAHLGNWELLPQYAPLRLKTPLHIVARESENPFLEEKIVKPLRERFGVEVFHKKNALMRIMKVIKKGEHAGFQIDQKTGRREGIRIPFFGKEAPTLASPALLQIRFGVTVIPVFIVKTEMGKQRLIIREAIQWEDNGESMDDQITELTKIHQKVIEDIITEYPEQWFWMHNRWGIPKSER